ncbi:hypothetical protein F8144_33740 [Streptomyces triticiradicis]|uniref:Uncharacterized protein n=1 Tax=Streptomyces triticiradicis TaxID=2651189 RepID=A0A7J5D928_9ACTN|nr:hypothetical protein F8144_33740 [Streptomyces triticiradicis]
MDTCRTRGVQAAVARPIMVRNAHETVLWWDAQVRRSSSRRGSRRPDQQGWVEAEDGQAAGVRAPDTGGA